MLFAIGPALGALSTVSSLLESAASNVGQAAGNELSSLSQYFTSNGTNGQPQSQPAGSGSSTPFDSSTLAALISLQGQNATGTSGGAGLFAKLDANGDGSISKSEFENALSGAGVDTTSADSLFSKLDANGDGSITKGEIASARGGSFHHHRHHVSGGSGGGAASLLDATNADGSTTQTSTNADGSSTTTITYADGSTVSSTMPAASQNGGTSGGGTGNSGNGNLIEKLIQIQSMLLSQPAATTAAVA